MAANIAAAAGRALTPMQRQVCDLFGERLPNGLPAYSRAVLIAPRRSGKSLLMFTRGLTAGLTAKRSKAFYASHRRETAAAMWRTEWFPLVTDSPQLRRLVHIRRGNGSEALTWHGTESTFALMSPDGNAMRSFASNLALIDEAREWSPDQGADVEAGVFPTQATGKGGQTVFLSSAGDARSVWLRSWVDRGRIAAQEGRTTGLAYVEYSAPLDADPDDEQTWWGCHPGLGYHVNIEALRDDHRDMAPSMFAAEYLGWWPDVLVDAQLIDAWATDYGAPAMPEPVAFALELDERREWASIVAAGGPGARPTIELIDHRQHGPWVIPRLYELCARHGPIAVAWDAGGPANALAPELATLPARLQPLRTQAVTAAAGWFYDLAVDRRTPHRADLTMTQAVAAGRRRRAGGAWLFDRREPGAGPLLAATLAAWVLADGKLGRPGIN